MAKKGYESEKTGRKVDDLLDKIDNLNVPEWALQESKPSYTAQEVHALPENTSIPKKTSDLVNDRGFITQESDPTVPGWAKQPTKPGYTAQEVGALPSDTPLFSGDYNDLRNKPAIPAVPENVSAFNNDAGYLTVHQDISGKEDKSNKVTSLSIQNTDTQYPSAKAVFDNLSTKQDTINDLGSIRSGASEGTNAYQVTGDKDYDTSTFSGLGRKNLTKNVVGEKNVLTQAMMSEANTIYKIQYDYDLNGQTITIPEGCTLEFDGGSLANGTIVGGNTSIKAEEVTIFKNIHIDSSGTWNVGDIYSKWFASTNEALYSTIDNILNMNNEDVNTNIYIRGDYDYVPSHTYGTQAVKSNSSFFVDGTIAHIGPQDSKNLFDFGPNAKNISFYGGTYIGSLKDTDDSSTPNIEYGHCFMFKDAENIMIDGCIIRNFTGDGIAVSAELVPGKVSRNITIRNCTIDRASRNGITIICAKNAIIENCTFKNITRKAPSCAIDIEPNSNTQPSKSIEIKNCLVEGCTAGILFSNTNKSDISDIIISNCVVTTDSTPFTFSYIKNMCIENSQFTQIGNTGNIFISILNNILLTNNKFTLRKAISNSGTENLYCTNNTFIFPEGNGFAYAEGIFEGNVFEVNGPLFSNGTSIASGHRQHFVLKNNIIKCKKMLLSNTQDMIMEGNRVTLYNPSDIDAYFLQGSIYDQDSKAIIRDNIFDIDASTRHIQFWPACNIDFSQNTVKVKSDKPVVFFAGTADLALKNITGQKNVFILPDRFISKIYSGINELISVANKEGDIVYFDSIKRYATFNGSKWIDANGFTAALSSGKTTERPTNLYGSDNGFQFFDTDLGKPIYNKVTIGSTAISKANIAMNKVDEDYLGVTVPNTLTQGVDYKYETTNHLARWFKAAFRKTQSDAYDEADEILICESNNQSDHVFFKAPDPTVYPYVYYCNRGNIVVTAAIKNITMEWVDATGTVVS